MLKNKLCMLLCLCFVGCACAESPSIISREMIQAETVNYSKTAVVELGDYNREYSASATEFYPHTYTVALEVDNASFLEYRVARNQEVKKGDILAAFALNVDEAGISSAKLALESAQKAYAVGMEDREDALDDLIQAQKSVTDPYQRELSALRVRREKVALEQYRYQQECQIESLTETLAELEEANSQSYLIAPFDGIVTAITYKREGEKVYQNEGLITLYREEDMLLKISNDQLHFRYGMPVTVTLGAKNAQTVVQGTVVAADNMLSENRQQGAAYIRMSDVPEGTRLTHMSVSGASEHLQNVMIIPRRASTMEGGKSYVECLINGALQKRYINIGLNTMADMWVVQGLKVGDTVIID